MPEQLLCAPITNVGDKLPKSFVSAYFTNLFTGSDLPATGDNFLPSFASRRKRPISTSIHGGIIVGLCFTSGPKTKDTGQNFPGKNLTVQSHGSYQLKVDLRLVTLGVFKRTFRLFPEQSQEPFAQTLIRIRCKFMAYYVNQIG